MLDIHSDSVDYRELLSPPLGYETDFVIGTTYSLDLETLTAACAIIGSNAEADNKKWTGNPQNMLVALRRASGKLLIFCQGGQIKKPNKPNKLFPLLDDCVCEVNLKNKRSFHPKVWFVRYKSEDGLQDKFRLVVLSRNLTFDRSWDVAVAIESAGKGDKPDTLISGEAGTGEAMNEFLMWLSDYANGANIHNASLLEKIKKLTEFADEILSVKKWKVPGKEFEGVDFIPYGIWGDDVDKRDNLFDPFHKMFVISPFLSGSVIEDFYKNRLSDPDCTLITRKSELHKLSAKKLLKAFNTYTVKDDVVDGEERISEYIGGDDTEEDEERATNAAGGDGAAAGEGNVSDADDGRTKHDIHAKVYLRTKGSESELYIGSANASENAFRGGNVECMLRLSGQQKDLSVNKLKRDLFGSNPTDKSNPFEPVEQKDYKIPDEDAVQQSLERALREFAAVPKSAVVEQADVGGDKRFKITVALTGRLKTDVKFSLLPLMQMKQKTPQPISEQAVFDSLLLWELSEWYVVTASAEGKVLQRTVKITTDGIPLDRDTAVLKEVIKDPLAYIASLLSGEPSDPDHDGGKIGFGNDDTHIHPKYDKPILYERMLKAAASSREKLQEVRDVIIALSEDANEKIVPEDFELLYEQFRKAVGL